MGIVLISNSTRPADSKKASFFVSSAKRLFLTMDGWPSSIVVVTFRLSWCSYCHPSIGKLQTKRYDSNQTNAARLGRNNAIRKGNNQKAIWSDKFRGRSRTACGNALYVPEVQGDSRKQGDAILMSLPVQETASEQRAECKKCVDCGINIDKGSLSFEQKLIEDEDFCRRCWDRVMDETNEVRLPSLMPGHR